MHHTNRREFVRARVSLPARLETLKDKEVELVKKGLGISLFRASDQPDPLEEFVSVMPSGPQTDLLYRCFKNISNKLDFLIEQLTLPPNGPDIRFEEVVELSGSGFKCLCDEPLPKGAFVKVDLLIPSTEQFRIELIAEIIRTEQCDQKGKHVIAARILEIDETARDVIIQTVFKKQRKIIRKEKAQREGGCEQG